MYTAYELKNLSIKPRISDISLQVLADYYTAFMYPFIYRYSVKKNGTEKDIDLRFEQENFCHLLGLETIAKFSVPHRKLHKYKGKDGWDNIYGNNAEGFILDIPHLKGLNRKKFQSMKAKFVYFFLLPNLIDAPLSVDFKNENVEPPTRIDCELIFYNKVKDDNAIIHLGIEKEDNLEYYIPKTFFVEKVSERQDDIYLAKQEDVETAVLDRVIML